MSFKIVIEILVILNGIYILKSLGFFRDKTNIIIASLIVCCVCIELGTGYSQIILDKEETLRIPLMFIFMFGIMISESNRKVIRFQYDNLLIFILVLLMLLQGLFVKIDNWVTFWTLCCTYFGVFLIGIVYRNLEAINNLKISNFFSCIAIYNGFLGIMQFITNKKLLFGVFNDSLMFMNESGEPVKRVVGIAGTNNAGGNLGFILFTIVLYNFLRTKSKFHFFALIMTSIFSILTLTRIGYVGIAVTIFINFLITKWNTVSLVSRKICLLYLGILLFLVIMYLFGDQIINVLFEQRGNTQDARGAQFSFIFRRIMSYKFIFHGIGTGQYKIFAFNNLGKVDIDIHSQYICMLVENGCVAVIIFAIFNLYLFAMAIKQSKNRLELAFVVSLFTGNLICCNFNPNEYYTINVILYYMLIYNFCYNKKSSNNISEREVLTTEISNCG